MEKITNQENKSNNIQENLILNNRKNLKLEGIVEVLATSDSILNLKLKDTNLVISGENINILKLDVNLGILEAEGKFDAFKFGKSANLFKRIFKWKYLIFFN